MPNRAQAPPPESSHFHSVIIGAGPAGLATAACLHRAGVPAKDVLVLERNEVPGSSWHTHYDRLHLHTMKRYSHLPYQPFPADYPQYPSRQQVADYLLGYADAFDIRPRFGHSVQSAQGTTQGWQLETAQGLFSASHLICATGYSNEPKLPTWPGQDRFGGEVLHSKAYRNADKWRGKRMLIVGIGNSAAEIAMDCFERGVAETTLSVRSPVHVVPRDTFGVIPSQLTGMAAAKVPPRVADALMLPLLKRVVGDLEPWGLRRPKMGPAEQVARKGKVPLIDIGTVSLIKQGFIHVAPGIERFTEEGVCFTDGTERQIDVVVCATGYRPALERLFGDDASFLNERGYPRYFGAEVPGKRLWFVGFRNPLIGQLYDIHQESLRAAAQIVGGGGAR